MTRLFLLVALLVGAASAQTPAPPALGEYAVLGVERVSLGARARVENGAAGAVGTVLGLGPGVRVGGAVAADHIRLGRGATANRFFCRFVTAFPFGRVVGGPVVGGGPLPACRAFTPPLVAPTELPAPVVTAGSTDLRVPPRTGTAPVAPASFRDVRVGPGALLQLAGGAYAARSIRIAPGGRLVCVDACRIGVLQQVVLGPRSEFGAASGVRLDGVRVDVAGGPGLAFGAGAGSAAAATIYAPNGRVVLRRRGAHRGAFVGRVVTVGPRVIVRAASAL